MCSYCGGDYEPDPEESCPICQDKFHTGHQVIHHLEYCPDASRWQKFVASHLSGMQNEIDDLRSKLNKIKEI